MTNTTEEKRDAWSLLNHAAETGDDCQFSNLESTKQDATENQPGPIFDETHSQLHSTPGNGNECQPVTHTEFSKNKVTR